MKKLLIVSVILINCFSLSASEGQKSGKENSACDTTTKANSSAEIDANQKKIAELQSEDKALEETSKLILYCKKDERSKLIATLKAKNLSCIQIEDFENSLKPAHGDVTKYGVINKKTGLPYNFCSECNWAKIGNNNDAECAHFHNVSKKAIKAISDKRDEIERAIFRIIFPVKNRSNKDE